jgi:hypothetical protein
VKKRQKIHLDFEIDSLTNSIVNTFTGDSFDTDITRLTKADLKTVTKKKGWSFNWTQELKQNDREVYKLTIVNNPTVIQGLISFTIRADNVFMHLLESAPFNIGQNKIYEGVAGNLVAFACKTSFKNRLQGFVSFFSKTNLIDHYEKSLGAYHFGGHLMVISTDPAQILVDKYFKE